MSMRIERLLLCAGLLLTACYQAAEGREETCNYEDDDLDGMVDNGFVSDSGTYSSPKHCGACGRDCRDLLPTAETVRCAVRPGGAVCEVVSCPPGTRPEGTERCVPDGVALCLPCGSDRDCAAVDSRSTCIALDTGNFCLPGCASDGDCPDGFTCHAGGNGSTCRPRTGLCGCGPEDAGDTMACLVADPGNTLFCPGQAICDGETLSPCVVIATESCDGADNDCDGLTDEDFAVDGQYLHDEHCCACHVPCYATAPHLQSSCRSVDGVPACVRECEEGFLDMDGSLLTGCECVFTAGTWPPSAHGVDGDCDGDIDDTGDWVYVSPGGLDTNPGTLAAPVRTIDRGMALAAAKDRVVFVAGGDYAETVSLRNGVSVFGGYRADFGDRDLVFFTSFITGGPSNGGLPSLIAQDIDQFTEFAGFTVDGSDALSAGQGSTAVVVENSTDALHLRDLIVAPGNGSDGANGTPAASVLAQMGIASLASLNGVNGAAGQDGFSAGTAFCANQSTAQATGGVKVCPTDGSTISGGHGGRSVCPATGCVIDLPCGNAGCSDFTVNGVCDFAAVYADAVPNPTASPGQGTAPGAAGDVTFDAPTTRYNSNFCDDNPTLRREGDDGGDGGRGTDGGGGQGGLSWNAVFNGATGLWVAADGTDGSGGTNGSGGGGGTAGNGYDVLSGSNAGWDQLGGAGGGGGSGGCGMPGGRRGRGGGSVIGVVLILTDTVGPVFENVQVVPGEPGDGGNGGSGAGGGAAGNGGMGGDGNFWCARNGGRGGDGGRGGAGGGGGGGAGGSVSGFHVVFQGPLSDGELLYWQLLQENNRVDALPQPGRGGAGGYSPGQSGTRGADGTATAFRLIF